MRNEHPRLLAGVLRRRTRDADVADVTDDALARAMFAAYGEATGGQTWDKKPIPPYDVIRERTPHVAAAWEAAARKARAMLR